MTREHEFPWIGQGATKEEAFDHLKRQFIEEHGQCKWDDCLSDVPEFDSEEHKKRIEHNRTAGFCGLNIVKRSKDDPMDRIFVHKGRAYEFEYSSTERGCIECHMWPMRR